ncbi:hypothetical protein QWZ08_25025 [Ferruginibacter paludis]|uniref:hypothetical protein n=1 Tax=Ferruginibacter paludis TaxID=1310417 RepID=UPI0025B408F7|nr:hypothetical protein [Ferruginibacter paludis]MDN3658931.1 hypothetical protein [Ferruginibacter paludis]
MKKQSELEEEMKNLVAQMADLFAANFTTKSLAIWLIRIGDMVNENSKKVNDQSDATSFLFSFTNYLLPSLIEAKSLEESLQVTLKELPEVLSASGVNSLKEAMVQINAAFLNVYNDRTYAHLEILEIMGQIGCFMALVELYIDYHYWHLELYKMQTKQAA